MKRRGGTIEAMVRRAFELVIALRAHRESPRLLGQAIAFLEMLQRDGDTRTAPVMVSVRAVRLRRF